jgi:hypothetical protein
VIPANRQRNYLQSALYVIIAGICATILLERLLAFAESAEKLSMEATVSRLQAGLYARMAFHALRNEQAAIEALERTSPFVSTQARRALPDDHIYAKELNYLGEFDQVPASAAGGQWLYDRSRNELVYLPRQTRYLELLSPSSAPGVRFKVDLLRSGARYTGVSLQPTAGYRWEPPL